MLKGNVNLKVGRQVFDFYLLEVTDKHYVEPAKKYKF